MDFTSGSSKNNSFFSFSYLDDQGQTIADNVKRITGAARSTFFISEVFSFGFKLSASYRDQQAPGADAEAVDAASNRSLQ